jgi:beta-glucanase (GH16 family)
VAILRSARVDRPWRWAAAVAAGLLALSGAAACASSDATSNTIPTSAPSSPGAPSLPTGSAAKAVTSAGWTQTLNAEFDGSQLDTKIWRVGEPWQQAPGFQQGPDAYCPLPQGSQVTVSGGQLHLNATVNPKDKTGQLLSCGVSTRGSFSMTHGYVETRVKLPTGAGLWPSFWLLGNGTGADGWPKTGEIDAFEFINNGSAEGTPFVTIHWAGNCPDDHCSLTKIDPTIPRVPDFGTGWVTYGLLRTADSLTIYINGKAMATMTRGQRNPQGAAIGDVIFNGPMHIKLDLSAGGWATNPHVSTQPGEFSIDYVRAWS